MCSISHVGLFCHLRAPIAFFYVMAALCKVDRTDQIRCIDVTLCQNEKKLG